MRVRLLPAAADRHDGVSRYARELAAELGRVAGVEVVSGPDYDVLHLVAAHRYDAEWRRAKELGRRLVVTVHDLIPEHFGLKGPQYAGVAERREVLSAADAIIAVSQWTKDDIVATYGISADRIRVIHNGVSVGSATHEAHGTRHEAHGTLLWIGRRAGYKNFFWFVRAVAPLLWRRNLCVICTGGQGFGHKERLLMTLLGVRRRFSVVDADEARLAALYRHAVCLVMPSRAEGFGLPVVEAMAQGCPVVLPRAHVFPEVAGDAALFYREGSGREMRRLVEQCLSGDGRAEIVRRGKERATAFSWTNCAAAVAAVYRR